MALVGHSAGGHLALLGSKLGRAEELVMRNSTYSGGFQGKSTEYVQKSFISDAPCMEYLPTFTL